MGPTAAVDTVTPHTRPPADEDAAHMLVRTIICLGGDVELELICEPAFDYGRTPAEWTLVEDSPHVADASGAGQTVRLQTDLRSASRPAGSAPGTPSWQASARMSRLPGGRTSHARRRRRRTATDRRDRRLLAPLARARAPVGRSSLARGDPALRTGHQGTDLHAHGGDGGRADDLAPRDAGGRAQLGLSLHVDAGLDIHAAGAAPPRTGRGGGGVHAVRRRPGAQQRRRPADHVRNRRSP